MSPPFRNQYKKTGNHIQPIPLKNYLSGAAPTAWSHRKLSATVRNRTVNEAVLEDVTVKALNRILRGRKVFLAQLQENAARAIITTDTLSPEGIQLRLEDLQKVLQDFVAMQCTDIHVFDESLVRKLIKNITVSSIGVFLSGLLFRLSYIFLDSSANLYDSASFGQFLTHSMQRMHSVPFFRFLAGFMTSTSIGQTRVHFPQWIHLAASGLIRIREK